jgi:hypothetical protein
MSADEKVEAVARALCVADGKNPEERMKRPGEGAGFRSFHDTEDSPLLWEAYVAEAKRFVVAIEAMQPFIERARRW